MSHITVGGHRKQASNRWTLAWLLFLLGTVGNPIPDMEDCNFYPNMPHRWQSHRPVNVDIKLERETTTLQPRISGSNICMMRTRYIALNSPRIRVTNESNFVPY